MPIFTRQKNKFGGPGILVYIRCMEDMTTTKVSKLIHSQVKVYCAKNTIGIATFYTMAAALMLKCKPQEIFKEQPTKKKK